MLFTGSAPPWPVKVVKSEGTTLSVSDLLTKDSLSKIGVTALLLLTRLLLSDLLESEKLCWYQIPTKRASIRTKLKIVTIIKKGERK